MPTRTQQLNTDAPAPPRRKKRRRPPFPIGQAARSTAEVSPGTAAPPRRRKRRPPLRTVLFPSKEQQKRKRRRAAPDARAERQKQRIRRRQRYLLLNRLFTLALIVGAGVAALTLFFRVDTVRIAGNSRYGESQLLSTSGIELGDNLFLFSKRVVRRRLYAEYPYLDTIRIERKLPDEIVITVQDANPAAAVGSGSTYFYMDKNGKLLEQVEMAALADVPVVSGVTIDKGEVGKRLNMRRNEKLRQLTTLLAALEKAGLMDRVDFINLSDLENIRVGCDGHMYIRFGTIASVEDLDYKMRFAERFVEETSPSLYCEIEVSGEVLWEGKASYRVIPCTEEEVAAQARDDDGAGAAVLPNLPAGDIDPNAEPNADPNAEPNADPEGSTDTGDTGDSSDSGTDAAAEPDTDKPSGDPDEPAQSTGRFAGNSGMSSGNSDFTGKWWE